MELQRRHNSNPAFIDISGTSEKILNSSMLSSSLLFHPSESSSLFSHIQKVETTDNADNNRANDDWYYKVELSSDSESDSVKTVEERRIDLKFESLSTSSATAPRKYKFANVLTIRYKNNDWQSARHVVSCMDYFKNSINPVSLEIGIENMRVLSIDKISVTTRTEKDLEILVKHLDNHETLLASKDSENLNISMSLNCAHCSIRNSNFLYALVKQNRESFFKAVNFEWFTFQENCIVSRQCVLLKIVSFGKINRGSFVGRVVVEIAPILWSFFYKRRLNLGFGQVTARPRFYTRQCYLCLEYGDRRQRCTGTLVCKKCFGNHLSSECRRPLCGYCYPCSLENEKNVCNYNIHHMLKDNRCPSYIKMVMLEVEAMKISDKDKKIVLSDYRSKLTKYGNVL